MVEWIKTYNTIEVWTLIVAIATLFVTIMTYCYNRNINKKHKLELLKRKQARLKGMENHMRWGQVEISAAAHLRGEMAALEAEIEELKSQM